MLDPTTRLTLTEAAHLLSCANYTLDAMQDDRPIVCDLSVLLDQVAGKIDAVLFAQQEAPKPAPIADMSRAPWRNQPQSDGQPRLLPDEILIAGCRYIPHPLAAQVQAD